MIDDIIEKFYKKYHKKLNKDFYTEIKEFFNKEAGINVDFRTVAGKEILTKVIERFNRGNSNE